GGRRPAGVRRVALALHRVLRVVRDVRARLRDGGSPSRQARAARSHRGHASRAPAPRASRRCAGGTPGGGAGGPAGHLRGRGIPTLPLGPRNRLAALILTALSDAGARHELAALASADGRVLVEEWLGADEPLQQAALRARARRASEALATLPLASPEPSLAAALDAAATLHDAGLHFEVHELLEPHWARAGGPASCCARATRRRLRLRRRRSRGRPAPSRSAWPATSVGSRTWSASCGRSMAALAGSTSSSTTRGRSAAATSSRSPTRSGRTTGA